MKFGKWIRRSDSKLQQQHDSDPMAEWRVPHASASRFLELDKEPPAPVPPSRPARGSIAAPPAEDHALLEQIDSVEWLLSSLRSDSSAVPEPAGGLADGTDRFRRLPDDVSLDDE